LCLGVRPLSVCLFAPFHHHLDISTILFTNPPEFLSRIVKAATAQGLKIEARPVEYYDAAKYSGKTGRFRKQAAYSHQHEYRIAIKPGMEDALLFDVGDLSDITSEVIPFVNADKVLKFSHQDARDTGLDWD
jgi:hypothetical protein